MTAFPDADADGSLVALGFAVDADSGGQVVRPRSPWRASGSAAAIASSASPARAGAGRAAPPHDRGARRAERRPHRRPRTVRVQRAGPLARVPRALVRPRRRRRLLRARARQPRPAPPDRRALPRRARHAARAALRPHPAGRRGVAPRRQPLLRLAGAPARGRAPAAPTSARCPTASTPCRSSATSSSSCCRRSSPPRPRARPIRRGSPGRPGWSRASARASSSSRCAPVAERIRRATPRAALLSTLAGIALDVHLARLPLPRLRAADRRAHDARHRAAHLLRPRALPRRAAGRPRRGRVGTAARLGDRHRAGADAAACRHRLPPAGAGRRRPRRRARRPPARSPTSRSSCRWGSSTSSARCRTSRAPRPRATAIPTAPSLAVNGLGTRRRRLLRLVLPDHDLHRPSGLEGAWARARATRC